MLTRLHAGSAPPSLDTSIRLCPQFRSAPPEFQSSIPPYFYVYIPTVLLQHSIPPRLHAFSVPPELHTSTSRCLHVATPTSNIQNSLPLYLHIATPPELQSSTPPYLHVFTPAARIRSSKTPRLHTLNGLQYTAQHTAHTLQHLER